MKMREGDNEVKREGKEKRERGKGRRGERK